MRPARGMQYKADTSGEEVIQNDRARDEAKEVLEKKKTKI